jgi:hypothetical protein
MKSMRRGKFAGLLSGLLIGGMGSAGWGQTNFTVTSPNYIYAVNGILTTNAPSFSLANNCPPLTLVAGNTYTFTVQTASVHPMVVVTQIAGLPIPEYTNAAPQNLNVGVVTLTIPATNFPQTLYYQCSLHKFYGVINVVPPPPPNQIISATVSSSNVVLVSTGVPTSFVLVPQFTSNLVTATWQPVAAYTNSFSDGTNVTTFDRLDPICGPNVFLRISQQPPVPLQP